MSKRIFGIFSVVKFQPFNFIVDLLMYKVTCLFKFDNNVLSGRCYGIKKNDFIQKK